MEFFRESKQYFFYILAILFPIITVLFIIMVHPSMLSIMVLVGANLFSFWFLFTIVKGINMKLEYHFVFTAMIIGFIYSVIYPPFTVPDERTNFFTSYSLANSIAHFSDECVEDNLYGILGTKKEKIQVRDVDEELLEYTIEYSKESYKIYTDNSFFAKSEGNVYIEHGVLPYSSFPAYTTGTVAILIGRFLNLSPFLLVYIVRCFHLLFYVICCFFAIKLIPVGKEMLFLICTMPLSLQQAMSCSYDSGFYAVTFLYIAFVFFAKYSKKILSKKIMMVLFLFSIVIAPIKGICLPLIFLVYIIPQNKYKNKKQYLCFLSLITVASIVAYFLSNLKNVDVSMIISDSQQRMIEYSDSESIYMTDILKNPMRYVGIIVWTFLQRQVFWTGSMTDTITYTGSSITFAFLLLFLLTACTNKSDTILFSKKTRIAIFCIYTLVYGLLCIVALFVWGGREIIIAPIRGSYLLPVLPLLGFLFRGKLVSINIQTDRLVIVSANILQYIILFCILFQMGMIW